MAKVCKVCGKKIRSRNKSGYCVDCYVISDETRKKISETSKGRVCSEETRKKLSEANKGKFVNEETRKKLSETSKGRVCSEETKKKLSEANKGKFISDETRKKISESEKGKVVSEETRRKLSDRVVSEETRKKLSEAKKGRVCSEETRKKLSINAAKQMSEHKFYTSKPEKYIKTVLEEMGINFTHQFRIENRCYDFMLPDYDTLIEVDGEYWHNREDSKIVDVLKNELAKEYGYRLVRIWDYELDKVWRII